MAIRPVRGPGLQLPFIPPIPEGRVLSRGGSVEFSDRPKMTRHRIYSTSFGSVYPLYVAKAERKGRTKAEVDHLICWLTGYSAKELEGQLQKQADFETFFREAPKLNPARRLIKGTICGVRIEEIQEPLMQEIRYLDKIVDEMAKGKAIDKICRQA